jgi:uncharacterized protein (TIGR00369 family)
MSGFGPIGQEETFLGHVGGIEWSHDEERITTRLIVDPHHANPNGTVHGGVLLTLLDFTLGAEVEHSLGAGQQGHPITIQLSSSLIGAATVGETVVGTAIVTARTKTMSFVEGRIVCGDRVLATASAVFRNPRMETRPATAPAAH